MPNDPFRFDIPPGAFLYRAAYAAARPLLSWILNTGKFARVYEQVDHAAPEAFAASALRLLDINVACAAADLATVPASGPLIVASNHPHGAADGLVIAAELARVRGDVRLLANQLLSRIPELRASCFFVHPFGGPKAHAHSRAGLRAAHLWLRQGGALVIFPAGEVAHHRRRDGAPIDSPWPDLVGRLARQTGAQVLPAFIGGANSSLFYAAGRLHPAFRTVLLARELLKKRGQPISLRFGAPLSAQSIAEPGADAALATRRVREAVEALARVGGRTSANPGQTTRASDPLAREISRLSDRACLVESGAFQVFCAEALQIPLALEEIGRLRAITYRAVGEGTGAELDLDVFDDRYLHLFSWDRERQRIAGAYRIGLTDRLLAAHGVDGLYTRTLFRYGPGFIDRLSPALELGRSFIRAEYQRSHAALLMLWRGIGRFVTQHARYRILFGPVSISTRYSDSSHALLKAFLEQNHLDRPLAELVEAINPLVTMRAPDSRMVVLPKTIEDADRLISTLEADGKGMPVLLRQYLKLNARLIGFNVDRDFGDVVDALMMVDLTAVEPAILARYLGRDDAAQFLVHHRSSSSPRAA